MKIIFRCLVLLMVFCLRMNTVGAVTRYWVGNTLAAGIYDWKEPSNWSMGIVPTATDDVVIGLVVTVKNPPTVIAGDNQSCKSITFGALVPLVTLSLTVNGILNVSGDIYQSPALLISYKVTLAGNGKIDCNGNLQIGSSVIFLNNILTATTNVLTLITTISNLHVANNVSVNGTTFGINIAIVGLILGDIDATFSIQNGTTSIDGQLLTTSTSGGVLNTAKANVKFSLDALPGSNAKLKLSAISPIDPTSLANSIDFYNSTLTGESTVEYSNISGTMASPQTIYSTVNSPAYLDALPALYQNLTFSGAGIKKAAAGLITVADTVNNSASSPIDFLSNASTVRLIGTNQRVIGGTYVNTSLPASPIGTVFYNLTSSASTVTLSGRNNIAALGTLAFLKIVSDPMTIDANASNSLTLLSNSTGDASIASLSKDFNNNSITATITGSLNVQRYVQGPLRRYMLLSSPVTNSTTAFTNGTINTYNLVPLIATTYITGPGGSANNFDDAPATGNSPSVFVYDENAPVTANPNLVVDNEYKPFGSIAEGLPAGNGFLYYFRGSRAVSNPFVRPFPATDNATLNFFGAVTKGTSAASSPLTVNVINFPGTTPPLYYIANTVGAPATLSYTATTPATKKGLNLIGNPYASVIDLRALYLANTGNRFYYMLIKNAPTGTASYSTKFAIYDAFTNSPGTGASRYALSGQGFFTLAIAANSSITFNETMKVPYSAYLAAPSSIPVFNVKHNNPALILAKAAVNSNTRGSISASAAYDNNSVDAMPRLRMELVQDSIIHNSTDINFDKNASSKFVPGEDAPYFQPSGQGDIFYSLTADSIGCFANYTCGLEKLKRIDLIVTFSSYGLYKLTSPFKQNIDERYVINLKDKYTNDSLDIIHNSEYNFNIDKNAASYAHDRFYLTIGIAPGHDYKLLGFSGAKVTAGIQLTWKTDNESNFTKFVVEKSTNGGKSFIIIGSLLSTGAGSYTFTDPAPGNGQFTYRLVQTLVTGDTQLSKNLVFDFADINKITTFIVYPSNAAQDIHIRLGQLYTNSIKINIVNSTGSIIKTISANNTDDVQQNVGNLMKGLYIVDAVDEATGKRIGSAKFFKQ